MRKIKEMLHKHDNESEPTLNTSSVDRTSTSSSSHAFSSSSTSGSTTSNVIGSDLDRTHSVPVSSSTTTTTTATVAPTQPITETHHHAAPVAPLRTSPERVQERAIPIAQPQPTVQLESERYVESERFIRQEPVHVERVSKPMVVQERIHPIQKEEIQPVIHREREQLDVKQITEMLHETKINPTLVEQRELAPEIHAPMVMRAAPIMPNIVSPSSTVDSVKSSQVIHAPIVEETIKKTIIEEVQPVLERDVITPTVIKEVKPIYEKIVEAPHVERVFLPERELGVTGSCNFVETSEYSRGLHPQQGLTQQTTQTRTTTTTTTEKDLGSGFGSGSGLSGIQQGQGIQSSGYNTGLQQQTGVKSFPGETILGQQQQGSNLQKLNTELDKTKYPSTH